MTPFYTQLKLGSKIFKMKKKKKKKKKKHVRHQLTGSHFPRRDKSLPKKVISLKTAPCCS